MKVVPPTPDRIERLIRTAIRTIEEQFFQDSLEKLPTASLSKLDSLVDRIAFLNEHQDGPSSDKVLLSFHELKADPGKPGVIIRASYGSHYRRMVPEILGILEFRSNNEVHRSVIRALELVKKFSDTGYHYLPMSEEIPIDGIIRLLIKKSL